MSDITIDGMALAPGVVETIVSIAAQEVEGVASVGPAGIGGFRSIFTSKNATQGIEVEPSGNDALNIGVRVEAWHGFALPDLAEQIRSAVVDAVVSQIGISVASVDVYIDGIQFDK